LAVTGDPAGGERELRAAVQLDPDSGRSWFNLGSVLAAQGKNVEAEASFRRALELAHQNNQIDLAEQALRRLDTITTRSHH
jgi:Tfp pilus assembly protein PilF